MSKSKSATWKQTGEWGKKSRKYQDQLGKRKAIANKIVGKAIKDYFNSLTDEEVYNLIIKGEK
jgi:Skp family chaperone for outer membrane proteins